MAQVMQSQAGLLGHSGIRSIAFLSSLIFPPETIKLPDMNFPVYYVGQGGGSDVQY